MRIAFTFAFLFAIRAAGQSPDGETERPRVLVSRQSVQVIFPRETRTAWPTRHDSTLSYAWDLLHTGSSGVKSLGVRAYDGERRAFPSLQALLAAFPAELCFTGMFWRCTRDSVTTSTEGGRLIVTLRDSAEVRWLFGLRPPTVVARRRYRVDPHRTVDDTVAVEYVAPLLPEPTPAFRAEAARVHRAYDDSIHRVSRYMSAGDQHWGEIWLAVGDSLRVEVGESRCRHDACMSTDMHVPDAAWFVGDSTVAALRSARHRPWGPDIAYEEVSLQLLGRRPGRTVLRVDGLTGIGDTMPSMTPPQRTLERAVRVTRPIDSLILSPRSATIREDGVVHFRVRIVDRAGEILRDLAVSLLQEGPERYVRTVTDSVTLGFPPGEYTVAVRLGRHADTARVRVTPKP